MCQEPLLARKRERWLVEQLAAAWNWSEEEVREALNRDTLPPRTQREQVM